MSAGAEAVALRFLILDLLLLTWDYKCQPQAALRCLDGLLNAEPPLPGMPHRSELALVMRQLEGTDLRNPMVRAKVLVRGQVMCRAYSGS